MIPEWTTDSYGTLMAALVTDPAHQTHWLIVVNTPMGLFWRFTRRDILRRLSLEQLQHAIARQAGLCDD